MNHTIFALKGTIAYTPAPQRFVFEEESFLVCRDGKVKGIWKELPDELKGIKVYDYTGKIIFPGMCDLHMHAPQYAFQMCIRDSYCGTFDCHGPYDGPDSFVGTGRNVFGTCGYLKQDVYKRQAMAYMSVAKGTLVNC